MLPTFRFLCLDIVSVPLFKRLILTILKGAALSCGETHDNGSNVNVPWEPEPDQLHGQRPGKPFGPDLAEALQPIMIWPWYYSLLIRLS